METSGLQKKRRYLEFEKPLQELDEQIQKLKSLNQSAAGVNVTQEVQSLEKQADLLLKRLMESLTPYQVVQLARHPDRPTALDYIGMITEDFVELCGDRAFADDKSIIGGLGRLGTRTVMFVAHQKGRSTAENQQRNFGMPRPEGYRKALRLMKLSERWKLPIICLIDTPGAYPGIDAEERGQAEAIARNILEMTDMSVPIVGAIIGEGGSGGALAIAVCDRLLMMKYSIYSVISPEGCAAITWKNGSLAAQAAEALKLTAADALRLGVAHRLIEEPLGGCHRDAYLSAQNLKTALVEEMEKLVAVPESQLIESRYRQFRNLGSFERASVESSRASGLRSNS